METITLTRLTRYDEAYTPPGRKTQQYKEVTRTLNTDYTRIGSEEAPVAFICRNYNGAARLIRRYRGGLYRISESDTGRTSLEDLKRQMIIHLYNQYKSFYEAQKDLQDKADKQIIIDNQLWEKCAEPKYEIRKTAQFGTPAIRIIFTPAKKSAANDYYRAADGEKARKTAREICVRNRDYESLAKTNVIIQKI